MLDRGFKVVFSVHMLWHIIVAYILISPGNPLAIKINHKTCSRVKYQNFLGIVHSEASFWLGLNMIIWLPLSFY